MTADPQFPGPPPRGRPPLPPRPPGVPAPYRAGPSHGRPHPGPDGYRPPVPPVPPSGPPGRRGGVGPPAGPRPTEALSESRRAPRRGDAGSRRGSSSGAGEPSRADEHPAARAPGRRADRRRAEEGARRARRRTPGPGVDGAGARLLRGLAGVLAGGLVVLALGLVVVEWAAGDSGVPGPGSGAIVAHVGAAVVAVVGQVVADRRRDRTGLLAALGVVVTASLVLGFGWFL
ncbi:hypothetical protein WHI96_18810 [Pseudonocardia tropica]|uniref:Translation initiation factor IF-2 n=1 Tax=Pseudonocardia tropica TaxID=681289 RepID=A0ABV1JY29_9PSEU